MKLLKTEAFILNILLTLATGLISGWLIVEKFFISSLITCISGILLILIFNLYRHRLKNKAVIIPDSDEFPLVAWLPVKDVMEKYSLSLDVLKQHIKNGLTGYIKNGATQNQGVRPITERELSALEVWPNPDESGLNSWVFKTEDIKKYIKNT